MSDKDAKERILKAAKEILDEEPDSDSITIRQIAMRAGVGVGLINYHFQTKDNLLYAAVGEHMNRIALTIQNTDDTSKSPVERLKHMLKALSDIGMKYEKQMRIGAYYQLFQGDFQIAVFLLPILREVFAGKKDENEIRMISFQIMITTNLILLRADAFCNYAGVQINHKTQRDKLMDTMIDNYLI